MTLQETSDILVTFLQNLVLVFSIPTDRIVWPSFMQEVITWVKTVVDFDFLKYLFVLFSAQVNALDPHFILILKNAFLPFAVAAVIIIPLKRWYYVIWWALSLLLGVALALATCILSYLALLPSEYHWITNLHYHNYVYRDSFAKGDALPNVQRSVFHEKFNLIALLISIAAVLILIYCFLSTLGVGFFAWVVEKVRSKRRFNVIKKEAEKRAPPGAKLRTKRLRFRLIFEQVKKKNERELQRNIPKFITRIAPLLFAFLIQGAIIGLFSYWKYHMESNESESPWNSVEYLVVFILIMVATFFVISVLILCNSLILFQKPRYIIFRINEFLTSKSLKLVFLVLSSLYIPLAVNVFAMFDCVNITCDEGNVFWNRMHDISSNNLFTEIYEGILKSPDVCTSCNFAQNSTDLFDSQARGHYGFQSLDELCPGGTTRRLMRSQQIQCSEIYPYIATSGALCLAFVVFTPFLVVYLVRLATRMLNSVDISHLYDYEQRKVWRHRKNKKHRKKSANVNSQETKDLKVPAQPPTQSSIQQNPTNDRPSYLPPLPELSKSRKKNILWQIRLALIDCSIESIYFPYKYQMRYFKLIFMISKVILSFTNVFGLTVFGFLDVDNKVGPQIILWVTVAVQFVIGLVTVILRPHMILAESMLMVVSTISIIFNCLFGLFLLYVDVEVPGLVVAIFMGINTIVLAIATICSLLFYLYRIRKNNYKTIQNRMIKVLRQKRKKARTTKTPENPPSEKQINRYLRGQGKRRKEPYIPVGRDSKLMLKAIKSAQKYQKAVGFSLNRISLDILINFFFFMSIVSVIAGVTLGVHYVVEYLNPREVDPFIRTRINKLRNPIDLSSEMIDFTDVNFNRIDDREDFRKEIEELVEEKFHFGAFPVNYCHAAYNFTFAGYDNWDSFTENCFCSRDFDFEERVNDRFSGVDDVEVELWRCRNGIIKRRFRAMTVTFVDVNSMRFQIPEGNFTTRLEGYEIRDFCDTEFKSMWNFNFTRSSCPVIPDEEESEESEEVAEEGVDGIHIAPNYKHWVTPLYEGETPKAKDEDDFYEESTLNFFARSWDSILSWMTRNYLF